MVMLFKYWSTAPGYKGVILVTSFRIAIGMKYKQLLSFLRRLILTLGQVIQVNLNSVFSLCRDIGAHMLSQPESTAHRRGSIINFASLLSFQGGLTVPAYAASKGAVAQLTKALSNEWTSKGITVNAIAPGYIET